MQKTKKTSYILFAAVFIILTGVIGIFSFGRLVRFYVYEEVDYNEWSADLGSKFETDVATAFLSKVQFVNFNGAVRRLLGQREMNGVVKLNNGYLLTTFDRSSDEFLNACADNVSALNAYLAKRGTALVYASTPYTSGKYDPELPAGIEDYGNDNIDRFVAMLEQKGVDTIDFRETMREDGINHYDMMYKTDHHRNTKAGFYAYGKLEDYIVEKTGCTVDERISDIDCYTITTYPEWHLGSRGQRTGRYYAGIDDFDLILPSFETKIQHKNGTVGTLEELAINKAPLMERKYTSRYTYDWTLGGSTESFLNLNCPNDIKVLIITDSFGNAVNPYLIIGFREFTCVYNAKSDEITPEYIESYDPDVVILMYYPQFLQESYGGVTFNFQGFS